MSDLTNLERKFVSAYIENGCNGRKAYEVAGYKKNETQSLVDSAIHRIVHKPQVTKAIQLRLEELDKSAAIRFETKRIELWDMAQTWRETGDVRAGVAAVNEMNKMDGHHAAQNLFVRSESYSFGQKMMDAPTGDTFDVDQSDLNEHSDENAEISEKKSVTTGN